MTEDSGSYRQTHKQLSNSKFQNQFILNVSKHNGLHNFFGTKEKKQNYALVTICLMNVEIF